MIKNKQESDFIIKKLRLNRIIESEFTQETIGDLKRFLQVHKYSYYNLRDKSQASGKFLYKVTAEQILDQCKNYTRFSVYESLSLADKKLLLQGEIFIDSKFRVIASLSDIKGISNREAMKNPKYNLSLDLTERKEPYNIQGLTKILDYIIEHNLIGMVVEFSYYDIPVGVNNENIIIWELRHY